MHAFINSFDFCNLDFVTALRSLLALFKLLRESKKIDRIMEKFADRYCECNPNTFSNRDIPYSILILNTDLHSNEIKDKMTKLTFIKNNRNIHSAGSNELINEFLTNIYDSILKEEIILDELSAYFKRMTQSMFTIIILVEVVALKKLQQIQHLAQTEKVMLIKLTEEI
jgi:brefeldin A-inhibited guanine nucleotide-exchange protein